MRKKLPNDRPSQTVHIESDGIDAYVTVGFYENDQPGEIFIVLAKEGSFLRSAFNMVALEASLLLQYGCPASVLVEKWKFLQSEKGKLFEKMAEAFLKAVSIMGGKPDEGHGYEGEPSRPFVPSDKWTTLVVRKCWQNAACAVFKEDDKAWGPVALPEMVPAVPVLVDNIRNLIQLLDYALARKT